MKQIFSYWMLPISGELGTLHAKMLAFTNAKKIVMIALLSALAAIFQSAGIIPGIGYFISPLATWPIMITVFFSFPHGLIAYILTNLLLLVLQPSELIVFPFTTGLLGIGIGVGLLYFKKRFVIITFAAFFLSGGIVALLYIFHFPVLGPTVASTFSIQVVCIIYVIALLYCWLWAEVGRFTIRKLTRIIGNRS